MRRSTPKVNQRLKPEDVLFVHSSDYGELSQHETAGEQVRLIPSV